LSTIAEASKELSSAASDVGQQVGRSTRIIEAAVKEAERADSLVSGLSEAASRIGAVIDIIKSIADQTNLLALNATIEAAGAGEEGAFLI
jgi:methyl-accepting chemotaxis protein